MNKKEKPIAIDIKESKQKREYFFDFLMLFLAVTLGFFADNYRETLSDKQKEKQNIVSIIKSIAGDTLNMEYIISEIEYWNIGIDSFILLKKSTLSSPDFKRKYYYFAQFLLSEDYYKQNDAGYVQLNSSGVLRLIEKEDVISKLAKYNNYNISAVITQEIICHTLFMQQADLLSKIIDLTYLVNPNYTNDDFINPNSIVYNSNLEDLYTDPLTIKEMYNLAVSLSVSNKTYIDIVKNQLAIGRELIAFLKKEYDLER